MILLREKKLLINFWLLPYVYIQISLTPEVLFKERWLLTGQCAYIKRKFWWSLQLNSSYTTVLISRLLNPCMCLKWPSSKLALKFIQKAFTFAGWKINDDKQDCLKRAAQLNDTLQERKIGIRKTEAAISFNKSHCKCIRQPAHSCQTLAQQFSHWFQRLEGSPMLQSQ